MDNYSASAKIIIFGEHAVVYGQPAIAVPISSLRAYVKVSPSDGGLRLQALDVSDSLDTETVQAALTLTARLVLEHIHVPEPAVTLSIRSQIPVASGLGSGAAVATVFSTRNPRHSRTPPTLTGTQPHHLRSGKTASRYAKRH